MVSSIGLVDADDNSFADINDAGAGAVVAVIDTGVAWKSASGVKQLPDLAGTEFIKGESFIAGLPEGLDDHAHGSHVAGTIAQTTNNGVGVTGVAFKATIMPLKVLTKDGKVQTHNVQGCKVN